MPIYPISVKVKLVVTLSFLLTLGACTSVDTSDTAPGPYEIDEHPPSVVAYDDYRDPLEWLNRPIFTFNDITYTYVLTPISRGYQAITPAPIDSSIGNFFNNMREPLYFINNLFQGKPAASGKSLLRFGINSTLGLLGLFDPADAWWDINREETTFGDTLAYHGVGYGLYVVLPLLGPSDLRDGTSTVFEYFAHPLRHIEDQDAASVLLIVDGFHDKIPWLARYPKVVNEAEDPYIFVRNLYLQGIQRDADALRHTKIGNPKKQQTMETQTDTSNKSEE